MLMDERSRFIVGVDVGTENIRVVAGEVLDEGKIAIVGYSEGKSAGMRKGVPANLTGPAEAIDRVLGEVERMSGREVRAAYLSINGAQILTTRTEGMIAVGTVEHEISEIDLMRVEDVAVMGRVPANRAVLNVVPLEYALDGQRGIKDPIGMSGARLEMRACVISALVPNFENLKKVAETANIEKVGGVVPSVVAGSKAVLSERQKENGVAVIDIGATTTGVAVFEEGDLQYVGVVPVGSNNITNDLAIVLAIDIDMAEEIKQRFITGDFKAEKSAVIKVGKEERVFERKEVEEVVKARLEEIFGEIRKKLKLVKYDQRLPEGVVLIGGGAKMRDIELFAKQTLEASVKVGAPIKLEGVLDATKKPEFATAIGLVLGAVEEQRMVVRSSTYKNSKNEKKEGFLKRFLGKF